MAGLKTDFLLKQFDIITKLSDLIEQYGFILSTLIAYFSNYFAISLNIGEIFRTLLYILSINQLLK